MVGTDLGLLAAWSEAAAGLMGRLDEPCLPALLDEALLRVVPFDLSVAFAYPDGVGPMILFDGFRERKPDAPLRAYLNGTYLLDPFYLACTARQKCGLYRMRDCAPDSYFESEYFHSWEVHPCISMESGSLAEEIAYLFDLPDGPMVAYSLMRSNGRPAFSEAELAVLRAVEPVVVRALRHHWRDRHPPPGRRDHGESVSARSGEAIEAAFATFAAERLTRQQQRIVQLVLRGHSNASVARNLGISEGTVKNHRHAIYDRLGVGTQSELFALFVRHVAG